MRVDVARSECMYVMLNRLRYTRYVRSLFPIVGDEVAQPLRQAHSEASLIILEDFSRNTGRLRQRQKTLTKFGAIVERTSTLLLGLP